MRESGGERIDRESVLVFLKVSQRRLQEERASYFGCFSFSFDEK